MGLDIGFETLEASLRHLYPPRESRLRQAVRSAIGREIGRQLGRAVRLPSRSVPRALEGFKFGSYSEIHYLRAFAARTAGYSLAEAYSLPDLVVSASVHSSSGANRSRKAGSDLSSEIVRSLGDAENSTESEDDTDAQLERIVPVARRRRSPFPYPHLVCFSDSSGIYLPVDFPSPFVVDDDLQVGSSTRLLAELDSVGEVIVRSFVSAARSKNEQLEHLTRYIRDLWWRLRHPALHSGKHRVPFVFH